MTASRASRTAVLVCQGRAVAHGRLAPDRFADPTAMPLLRPAERREVEDVRSGAAPADLEARLALQFIAAVAEGMVPRTLAIDDAVTAKPHPQLVILGAGLDGRAWRLPGLDTTTVFEVDQPASQREKHDRARALPADRTPHYVPVDFGHDDLRALLADAGHRADAPTTWIWEGVIPYLSADEVRTTLAAVTGSSAPGSRLIVNYQARTATVAVGRHVASTLWRLAGRRSFFSAEPWRSFWTPASMSRLLAEHRYTVTSDDDLLVLAAALGTPATRPASLRSGRVAVAELAGDPA